MQKRWKFIQNKRQTVPQHDRPLQPDYSKSQNVSSETPMLNFGSCKHHESCQKKEIMAQDQ